ncbi:co-chaperone DjlA [Permianibacter sp. IMCC34836]|uniref:co-chaperone DjlA n=1 Tax=Permianibacter fluminis TaxID=2738515 RepID=UPI001552620A|nr:co-chaperone DjlA [Permianibacter fluminis]NQD36906.1 co-chaperone DjlA [Permianibacter fluminis]
MGWWGKVLGGGLGYAMGGYFGALLGAVLGHQLDKGVADTESDEDYSPGSQVRVQTAFFTATFSVLGHIAKVDGRVSEHEIEFAREVMRHFALSEAQKQAAIGLFNQGKSAEFSLQRALSSLKQECGRRRHLLQTFFEIQIQSVMADGSLHPEERALLARIGQTLGFSDAETAALIAQIVGAAHFHQADVRQDESAKLVAAYKVLGVQAIDDDETIKRSYRKLMAQHHPDKLVAQGLPEEMMKEATERAQQIQQSYQLIRRQRGTE